MAVSTPPGRGGIGIVRLSGPGSLACARQVFRLGRRDQIMAGGSALGWMCCRDGKPLDRGYLTHHPAARSYTGEEVVELSCHGSPVIIEQLLEELVLAGAKPAAAGEFTFRAVLNGRMDLSQAEAVRDLIDAPTPAAARAAVAQLRGNLSRRMRDMREALVEVIARLEAAIEFAEEPDVAERQTDLPGALRTLAGQARTYVATYRQGRLLREGANVILAGRPNSGKSSLFNCLLKTDRAIVSTQAGTTRDFISERIDLGGVPITLVDTAGVREGAEGVEAQGVDRTHRLLDQADLVLLLCACDEEPDAKDAQLSRAAGARGILVATKSDLLEGEPPAWVSQASRVSSITGEGIDRLKGVIFESVAQAPSLAIQDIVITEVRHHDCLVRAADCLDQAAAALAGGVPDEVVLVDLYAALSHLGEITGEAVMPEVYDRIFSTFCIGK